MAHYNPIFKVGDRVRWRCRDQRLPQQYGRGPFIVATVDKEAVPTYESLNMGPLDAIDDPEVIKQISRLLNQHLTLEKGNGKTVLGPDKQPAVLPSCWFTKIGPRKKPVLPMTVKKRRKK